MTTWDPKIGHLAVCTFRGVSIKTLGPDKTKASADTWRSATVTLGHRTFSALVKTSGDSQYPLYFKPMKLYHWAEFDQFFDFRTSSAYDPDQVVAVNADTFTAV